MAVGDDTTLVIPGPGVIGDVETWSVTEAVTPFVVGDPAASGGSITAQVKSSDGDTDTLFTFGREAVLTTDHVGLPDPITGTIQEVNLSGLASASLTMDTVLSQLSAERVAGPQWADKDAAAFTARGAEPGQVGDVRGVSFDPSGGFVYVSSSLRIEGAPLTRISKFDADFNFVLEWAVSDGGSTLTVHPGDGFVYLLDSPNLTIHKYDPDDGTLLASADPVGVYTMVQAIPDSSGDLIVGVISGTVPTLGFMDSNLDWGSTVFMPGARIVPVSAAIHPVTGDIYVGTSVENAEDGSPSVLVYDSSLSLTGEITYPALHGRVV